MTTANAMKAAAAAMYWADQRDHAAGWEAVSGYTEAEREEAKRLVGNGILRSLGPADLLRVMMGEPVTAAVKLQHKAGGQVAAVDGRPVKAAGDLEPAPVTVGTLPGTFAGVLAHADNLDTYRERLGRKALARAAQAFEMGAWQIKAGHDGEPVAEVVEVNMRAASLWVECLWLDTPKAVAMRERVAESLRTGHREGLSIELADLTAQNGWDGLPEVLRMRIVGGALTLDNNPANDQCQVYASDDLEGRRIAL